MKKALKLVFVCSAIMFAAPSLIGMNNNPTSVTQQGDDFDIHYPTCYLEALQKIKSLGLNNSLDKKSEWLNAFVNSEDIGKWIDHCSGQYIDLGDNGAFFQVTTKGDGSCFDHANGWNRKDMADAMQVILNEPTDDQFQDVFRMIATYLLLDYESNDAQEGAKTILDAGGFHDDDFIKLTKNNTLKGLLERLSEKNKDGESEDERIRQSFKQHAYQILLETIPNDVRDAVFGGLETELEYVKGFLQQCLDLNNNNQLTTEWFSQNLPGQLKEVRKNDEDEKQFYWYLTYCFVFDENLRPLAYQESFSNLLKDTTCAHNGKEKAYIIKQTEQFRTNFASMQPKNYSSEDFKQWLISNVPASMMDSIIAKVNSVQSVQEVQKNLTSFLNNDQPIVSLQTEDIPEEIRKLSNPYWDLMLYVADKKLDTNQIKRITDLALFWGYDALKRASIAYINTFGAPSYIDPKTGQKFYHYANFRTSSDPETGIASGYIGASTYLSNLNEIVLDLNSGLVQFYNHGDDNTPPVLVVLKDLHYTRYIYVPKTEIDNVKARISENIRRQNERQNNFMNKFSEPLTDELREHIYLEAWYELNNPSKQEITSADQQYQSSLKTSIAQSGTVYNKDNEAVKNFDSSRNKMLAQDRRSMPNQIIPVIENNIYKLRYLIDWAQAQNFNPAVVCGFNLYKKLKYYQKTIDILLRFINDTDPNDALVGDEWLNALRRGNEILQKNYAIMCRDAFGLDKWIKLLWESSDWAKDYLVQNIYQNGQWIQRSDYVWNGVNKTDKLRRFIDVHNNRVCFNYPNDQFNSDEITQERLNTALSDIRNRHRVCNKKGAYVDIYNEQETENDDLMFNQDIQTLYRLAMFVFIHNEHSKNDKLGTEDVIKVLEDQMSPEDSVETKKRQIADFFEKHKEDYKRRVDFGTLINDITKGEVFTESQLDLIAFGQVLRWLVKADNGDYVIRLGTNGELYITGKTNTISILDVRDAIRDEYLNNRISIKDLNEAQMVEYVNALINGTCSPEDAIELAYSVESLGLFSSYYMDAIALSWLASRIPNKVMNLELNGVPATKVLTMATDMLYNSKQRIENYNSDEENSQNTKATLQDALNEKFDNEYD